LFAIVVGSESWHPGIIGLVAGKLVEKFGRPSFAMSYDTETGDIRCSARSIPGFHLGDAIRHHSHLLSGGGHAMAAGFGARLADVEQITESLNAYAGAMLTSEDFEPMIEVDAEVAGSELTLKDAMAMEALEPFGQGNPAPTFCVRGCVIHEMVPTKNESQKVRITPPDGGTVTGFFNSIDPPTWFEPRCRVDSIFKMDLHEWNGVTKPQWSIRHLEPSV
ncbi:MAG: DHHA1 domain-containing protein, partial [Fimbriimonadaceae bacterium]